MRIRFLGAAGTVTGSRFLVESERSRVLVDCGLFQGLKPLRLRNWKPFPVDPASIDAVVLSHAHLDHSGYLPALVRDGFRGEIHCTPPTRDLCGILLPDSGKIQEEDARYANRKRFSRHEPALPLYTEAEAESSLQRFRDLDFGEPRDLGDVRVDLFPAGHILGAASVRLTADGQRVLFSGDLGRPDDLLMRPPVPPAEADVIVMESTYGDRLHPAIDPIDAIGKALQRTRARGGLVLMPSFAVGRAQALLVILHRFFEQHPEERVPVSVNSPMATAVTGVTQRWTDYHRLGAAECEAACGVARFVQSVEESRRLNERGGPGVIIAGSGMLTGGRILHHLGRFAPEARNTIVLPGFQAPGTRGASLVAGAESLKVHGRYVPVKAEVVQLGVLSAHADRSELLAWLASAARPPRQVVLVHGEPAAADELRRRIVEQLGLEVTVPEHRDTVEVSGEAG